ncbi:thioredoxin [Siminovitchia acidinfaciens]|uniref:Thioredoxin n=1 Tax=Siminovitchia acidinfaciens TaxID=2321395 RepID=A0A429Y1N3_9BACI|nr:thioredoxin family protein [Siminovitchia acidinfaciens]RST75117.1 thioredoxin [Siminovitchia acidinfaciens]
MKKLIIFLVIIIALFAAIAGITKWQQLKKSEGNIYKKENLHSATIDLLDDPLYQNIILPEELEKKLNNKENVTVYFFSPTCPHCMKTTPELIPAAEKMGVDVYQFNLLEFEDGWNQYRIKYTPTLIHFKNGEEDARLVGGNPQNEIETWFEEHVK